MKSLLRALVLLMVAASVVQTGVSAGAQTASSQKRVVKIDDTTGELVDITQAQAVQQAPQQAAPGIVILNNQRSTQLSNQQTGQEATQAVIQDQPTNVIEDSPLSMSAAERRRRDRQNLEMQTEQRIVEKLEEARIEDERSRSERLFNKGFSSRDQQEHAAPVHAAPAPQHVHVVPAPVAPPVTHVVVEKHEEPKVNVREEVRAALDEMKPKDQAPMTQYYVQGLVGLGEYPEAKNVRGNMAMGFSLGMVTPERFVAEGTFQYSQYDIDTMQAGYSYSTPAFKEMTQYNFQAAVKYQILGGKVRPVIGAIAGYTYRNYEDQQYGYYSGSTSDVSTNAFDIGGLVGLDIQLTTSFSLGADFRYMKNVSFRENSNYSQSFVYGRTGKAVEEFNYYLGSLVGRFTF